MGKTEAPAGMYDTPEHLVAAIKIISFVAQSVRGDMGELTELGNGEVYGGDWGLAAWSREDEENESPQFEYAPLNIIVSWHQRVTRGCFTNRVVSLEETVTMLFDILEQMKTGDNVTYVVW